MNTLVRATSSATAFVGAFALSAANAANTAQFVTHASGSTGLQPALFTPIVIWSVLSMLFGVLVAGSKSTVHRRWALIGSACVSVPALVVFGFLCLLAVLGAKTDLHPMGSIVSAIAPAIAAVSVFLIPVVGGRSFPNWVLAGLLLVLSLVPSLLAVARVLLVP